MAEHYLKEDLYRRVRESPEIFEFLQAGSLDGIWYWDLEHTEHEWMSSRFWEVFGYDPTEKKHLASEWQDMIHPDDLTVTLENFEKHCADPNHPYDQIVRYRHKNGSTVWVRCRGLAIRNHAGKPIRMLGAHTNLTEQLRAQDLLRKSREALQGQYEALVRASGQLLYDWDPKTNAVSYGNVESALGYTEVEMAGGLAHWRELVHPEDREGFDGEIRRVLERKQPFYLEYRVRRKDGEYIPVEDRGYFFFDDDGNIGRMVGFVIDASEKKSLEEQLRQAQKMEAVGRLAGGVAHDFNNLLSVIVSYSELALQELRGDDPLRADIAEIRDAAKRATSLTGQLLAFSRRQVLQPKVLDLNVVVERMDKMLQRVIGEDIDLVTKLSPGLHPVKVDPSQIEQIVMNLAVNARDAMPSGGSLTIETANVDLGEDYVRTHAEEQPGPHVMIAISDTGIGMDAETKAKIFDPFFTTKELGRGTGLGLSTVYGIVKQSGGNIWVYTEPGHGTTFKVYLRPTEEAAVPAKRRAEKAAPARGTETVLVVEDEDGVRGVIRRVLEKGGYTVLDASNGEQAVGLCEQHAGEIHMVLTDVVLPKMGGRQLAEKLLSIRPELKLIYMSGYTDDAILHRGMLEPGVEFLEKPISPHALLEKVREVLT